eukprot:9113697-Pyramimonas_sp.AAC.1
MPSHGDFAIILTTRNRASWTVVLEASPFPVRNRTSTSCAEQKGRIVACLGEERRRDQGVPARAPRPQRAL